MPLRQFLVLLLFCSAAAAAASVAAVAGDWPLPHGPFQNGQGLSSWQGDQLPDAASQPRWFRKLDPVSLPAVAHGKLHVIVRKPGLDDPRAFLYDLLTLDLNTGRTLWRRKLPQHYPAVISIGENHAGSPVVDPVTRNILLFTPDLTLSCITPDGELIWSQDTQPMLGTQIRPHLRPPQLMVDNHLIYTALDTSGWGETAPHALRVFAFEKKNGQVWWHHAVGERSPKIMPQHIVFLLRHNDMTQTVIADSEGILHGLQAQTGQPQWRFELPTPANYIHVNHIPQGMLLTSDQGTFALSPTNDSDIQLAWRRFDLSSTFASSNHNNRAYIADHRNRLVCLNSNNGETRWELDLPARIAAAPILSASNIFVTTQDGALHLIRDEGGRGRLLSTFQPHEHVPSRVFKPLLVRGTLVHTSSQGIWNLGPAELQATDTNPQDGNKDPGGTQAAINQLAVHPSLIECETNAKQTFSLYGYNAAGQPVQELFGSWQQRDLEGKINNMGAFTAAPHADVGSLSVQYEDRAAQTEVRVLGQHPYNEQFTEFNDGQWPSHWTGTGGVDGFYFVRTIEGSRLLMKLSARQDRNLQLLFPPVVAQTNLRANLRFRGNIRDRRHPEIGLLLNGWMLIVNTATQQLLLYPVDQPQRKPHIARLPNLLDSWADLSLSVSERQGSTVVNGLLKQTHEGQERSWQLQANVAQPASSARPAIVCSSFGEILIDLFSTTVVTQDANSGSP